MPQDADVQGEVCRECRATQRTRPGTWVQVQAQDNGERFWLCPLCRATLFIHEPKA